MTKPTFTTLVDPLSGRSWRIPTDRLNPWHTVTINDDGWHMAHPIDCQLDGCLFDDEAQRWTYQPAPNGKYRWQQYDDDPMVWVEIGGDEPCQACTDGVAHRYCLNGGIGGDDE